MVQKGLKLAAILLAVIVGLYPVVYFIVDRKFGLLSSKSDELLINLTWNIAFYTHIILGGLALLIGWTQFSLKTRQNNLRIHRLIGKIYIVSVLISATASLYIAMHATGGIIASLGFAGLGIVWFYTTGKAYQEIKKGNTETHQKMMTYSYAACFAAVTLRIWLPLLTMFFKDIITGYRIVAWLCWIPNLIVAGYIVKRRMRIAKK